MRGKGRICDESNWTLPSAGHGMNILYHCSLKIMRLNSCTFDHLFALIHPKQMWHTKDTALAQTWHNEEEKNPNPNNAILYPCSERGKFNLLVERGEGALRTRQSFWCNHNYVKKKHHSHLFPTPLCSSNRRQQLQRNKRQTLQKSYLSCQCFPSSVTLPES